MQKGNVLTMRTLAPSKRPPFCATATPARDTRTLVMRQASLQRHADWFEASLPELLAAEKVCSSETRHRAQIEMSQRELREAEGWNDGWDEADTRAEPSLCELAAGPSLLSRWGKNRRGTRTFYAAIMPC